MKISKRYAESAKLIDKTKEYEAKEALEIIKYICVVYAMFLFILGAILQFQETIIQVTFMCVFAIIIDMINYGEFIVSEKGIRSKHTGFIRYKEIYRLSLDNRTLTVYTRNHEKPYKVNFAKNEDYADASRLYLELEDKMSELRSLYSSYKKNLLDI